MNKEPPQSFQMATRAASNDDIATTGPDPPKYSSKNDEICPRYSCDIAKSSILFMKHELSTPTTQSKRRNWKAVQIEVRGTMLLVRDIQRRFHAPHYQALSVGTKDPPALAPSYSRHPARVHTLQGGEAGIAADYARRKHVIRVRAGAEQFLLSTKTLPTMLEWIEALNTAIDISLPLESRRMPTQYTLPRPPDNVVPKQSGSIKCKLLKIWTRCVGARTGSPPLSCGDTGSESRTAQPSGHGQGELGLQIAVRVAVFCSRTG